ncbi:MAG: hypothetical protein P8186_24560 [Anaerolineae bacterium]|jgi:hypothetical protein
MQLRRLMHTLFERRREIRLALILLALIAAAIGVGLPFETGDA